MSIITISRRPFSRGGEIAEKVARELGYECVAREVLFDAAKRFDVPDADILRAIHDAPSFSDHFHYGRERYVAFFQAALLGVLQRDDIVYHGLAGHFFIQGVSHGLKVRIITGMAERVSVLTQRENISAKNAERLIKREDNDRRKWSRHLYGIDTWDPSLYDIVLNIAELTVDEAVEIICHAVGMERFRTTPESAGRMDDLVAGARVKVALIQIRPDVEVQVENGLVIVTAKTRGSRDAELAKEIMKAARSIPGVEDVRVDFGHVVRHYD
ncbi:MAG: cytidylate kinase-like family protein [Deltaproteobacteria bacterium]|nr:cytidylate kinase-like family protein [Deltaproteobacteria bacterium]